MKVRQHSKSDRQRVLQHCGQPLLLLIRLALGGILIFSGLSKLTSGTDFVGVVASYGMLPQTLAELFGTVLPWLELLVGVSLVLGLFTRLAAATALLLVV
ncbi:MAG: DoxX family protein, partial [Dehalococcoidia bacterium]|nr:DoxX family protein [Dehalococcoidia bacterium]